MEDRDIHSSVWLAPWDPNWANEFEMEKQLIIGSMMAEDHGAWVYHVGSTSVRNMPAKPIIDILVCPDREIPLEDCIPDLERIGYRNLGECGRPGRYFLTSGDAPGKTFYLHLCHKDHPVGKDQLLFQWILASSELIHAKYRYTKHLLESIFPDDRNMYREMKGLFIGGVLAGYRKAVTDESGVENI